MGRPVQQFLRGNAVTGKHFIHGKNAFRQGSGFVKHHRLHLPQGIQIVAPFQQNPLPRRSPYSGKKAQRDGQYQRAGAGNHQQDQGAEQTVRPASARHKGIKQKYQSGYGNHQRRINAGK